eukprot:gene17709-23301_t
MSYILLVNPQLISKLGIPATDVVISTALSSAISCFITGIFGNLPFGLAPGMGLSAYLTYGLVLGDGLTIKEAFTSCFIAGIILTIFSVLGISQFIMKIIPRSVKVSTIVGMGLQIAMVGMTSVQLVIPNEQTIVGLGSLDNYKIWYSFLANLNTVDGNIPGSLYGFLGSSIGTLISAVTGGTPIIVYVESAAGIKEGGRSGLTAVVIGFCFILSLILSPLFAQIPVTATSPVAILVGAMMMSPAVEIDWNNMSEAIPAFLTLTIMPLTFSITNGILFGLLAAISFYITTGQAYSDWQNYGKIRANADVAFSNGDLDQSIKLWAKVIELEPNNESNYYKRFRVYLRQNKLKEALSDLNSAINIKPNFENAIIQRAKIHVKQGKCAEAVNDYTLLASVNPNSKDLNNRKDAVTCSNLLKELDIHYNANRWTHAKDIITQLLRYAEASPALLLKRCQCYYELGEIYDAIADAGKVLKLESDNLLALQIRGQSYYLLGELESAMNHYRQELAQAYVNGKHFKEAKELTLKLLANDENNGQANYILGKVHMENEEYEEAIYRFKKANEILGNDQEVNNDLRKAETALKQSKQKDYYKTLGVSRKATQKEIKKAYRELAMQWHPDKHQGEEEKEKAEKQFQQIAEAHEVLTDDEKKRKYDLGEDVFENQGNSNPNQHFYHNPFGHQQFQGGQQQFHFRFN